MTPHPDHPRCGACRHFVDDAAELERRLPALLILSSAGGDSRGDQGLCRVHRRWLLPSFGCRHFEPRSAAAG